MSTLKEEKYPFISKFISGWLLLTGFFFILEVGLDLLGFPVVQAVTYDKGFEVMRASYAFSSFFIEAPMLIIAGILLLKKTPNSWLFASLSLFFMLHEFVFAISYFIRLNIMDQLSFDYLGYLTLLIVINIPAIFYLYKLRPQSDS